jgi:hypothetical protein
MSTDIVTTQPPQQSRMQGWMLSPLIAGGVFIALAKLLAGPLVLPLFSLLVLTGGFILAAALLFTGSRIGQSRSAAWVAAGALVFLGFAAALLSDGQEALAQLERLQVHGVASAGK